MYADQPAIDARRVAVRVQIQQLFEELGTPEVGRTAILNADTSDPARVTRSTTDSASGLTPMPGQGRMVPHESHTNEDWYLIGRRHDPNLIDIIAQPDLKLRVDFDCPVDGCPGIHGYPTFDFLEITRSGFPVAECKPRERLRKLAALHPGWVVEDPATGSFRNPTTEAAAATYGLTFAYVVKEDLDTIRVRNEAYLDRAYRAGPVPESEADPIIEAVRRRPLGVRLGELIADGVADPLVLQRLVFHEQLYVDRDRHFVGSPDHVPVYLSATAEAADAHRVTPGWAIWRRPPEAHLRPGDRLVWDRVPYAVENVGEPAVTIRRADRTLCRYDRHEIEGLIRTGAIVVVAREQVEENPGRAEADAIYMSATRRAWRTAERRADLVGRYLDDPKRQVPKGTSRASLERWMARQRKWFRRTGDGFVGFFPDARPGNPRDGLPTGIRKIMVDTIQELYFDVPTRPPQAAILGEIFRRAVEQHLWPSPDDQRKQWADEQQARREEEAGQAAIPAAQTPAADLARGVDDAPTDPEPAVPAGPAKARREPVGPVSERTLRVAIKSLKTRQNLVSRLGDRLAYLWKPWGDVDPDGIEVDGDWSMSVGHADWTELDLEGVASDFTGLGRFWLGRYMDASAGVELGRIVTFEHPSGALTLELFRRVAERYGTICDLTVMDLGPEHRTADIVVFARRYGKALRWRPKRAGRAGHAVEGPFWILDIQLLYGLAANTQPTKRARTMTAATDPKKHALWQLLDVEDLFDRYNAVAEARPRPIDGRPRREAFEAGFLVHGRPAPDIASDPLRDFYTSSTVDERAVRNHVPNGVTCDGLDYWHPLLDLPSLDRHLAERRRCNGDVSRLWVQIEGPIDVAAARQLSDDAIRDGYGPVLGLPNPDDPDARTSAPAAWVEARARSIVSIRVASRKEVEVLTAEIPALTAARRRGGAEYGYMLAGVLREARETERSQEERKKAEARLGRAAVASTPAEAAPSVVAVTRGIGSSRPSRTERLRHSLAEEARA